MAVVVQEVRRLDGGSPAKDVTARLVTKAAAALGLPNLLHYPPPPAARRATSGEESLMWECESRCSCTPLACIPSPSGRQTQRVEERELPQTPSSIAPALAAAEKEYASAKNEEEAVEDGCRADCTEHSCTETKSRGVSVADHNQQPNESKNLVENSNNTKPNKTLSEISGDGRPVEESNKLEEEQNLKEIIVDKTAPEIDKMEEEERSSTLTQLAGSVSRQRRRRAIADFEKEWTFRPRLNLTSLRLASRGERSGVPVSHRLYQRKTVSVPQLKEEFTFAPKLNPASLRLAQDRADRLPEVQERLAQLTAQRLAEACVHCTFHPSLSQRSLRMAGRMEAGFQARQQQLLLKRQKMMEEVKASHLQQQQSSYCKKSRPITLPTSTSPPPHHQHSLTPSPHSHPHNTPSSPKTPDSSREQDQVKGRLLYSRKSHKSSSSTTPGRRKRRSSSERERLTTTPPRRPSPSTSSSSPSSTPVSSPVRRCLLAPSSPDKTPAIPETPWSRLSDTDRFKRVKILAERAIKKKKVFVCRGGYSTIRRCLRERGWVEKEHKEPESPYLARRAANNRQGKSGGVAGGRGRSRDSGHTHCDSDSGDDGDEVERRCGVEGAGDGLEDNEYHMLCRAVRNADPNFVWTLRRDDSLYRNLLPSAFANHFAKASSFTTKVGLCANLRNLVWCGETHSDLFFPRCFLLSSPEEKDSFVDDYRFTTALNILKLVTDQQWGRYQSPNNTPSPSTTHPSPPTTQPQNLSQNSSGGVSNGPPVKIGPHGPPGQPPEQPVVPEEAVELALRACSVYLSSRLHEDIEENAKCLELTGAEWQNLINHYYKIVLEGGRFACSIQTVRKASDMLDELEKYLPQLYMDGARNIWIVKPGAMSRGRGIVCQERLEPILELVSSQFHTEGKWVVQKYIERPLLIYGTKFDIRQWFLITDWTPLTMWMYKDCYLRFATQRFTLDNMNRSIHLCNNSIQKNYENSGSRSELLPQENMWHSSTFKDYLQSLGQGHVWDEVIYPGMKHALTCALMVSQDIVEGRKNTFELYGADFMLTDDFKPWLIEINCSPTMEPSTSVTAQLCGQVMEDTIRVVLDRRESKEASTGKFELAYKQPKFDTPSYVGIQLCVEGVAIHPSHTHHHSAPALPVATLSYTKT